MASGQSDLYKFQIAVGKLSKEEVIGVVDILENPPAENKYETLKQRLLDINEESQDQKMTTLMTNLELGDQKPSQLLRRVKYLATGRLEDSVLKIIWELRLPRQVRTLMVLCNATNLEERAKVADELMEITRVDERRNDNPRTRGLTIFPMVNEKYPIIWFTKEVESQYISYVDEIQKILNVYESSRQKNILCNKNSKIIKPQLKTNKKRSKAFEYILDPVMKKKINIYYDRNSSHSSKKSGKMVNQLDDDRTCIFDISTLGPCAEYPYGYDKGSVCFYIKINKSFRWFPKLLGKTSELHENMPESLKTAIKKSDRPKVWIYCEGEHEWDKENIGEINYYPDQGFEAYYFPFKGQQHYQSPLVAVEIAKIKTEGLVVTLKCELWTKEGADSATFIQIMIRYT